MRTKITLLLIVATLVAIQTWERYELEEYKEFKKTLSHPITRHNATNCIPNFELKEPAPCLTPLDYMP